MILYFSGTGNSCHVALKLAALTGESVSDMGAMIKENRTGDFTGEERYIFVTPVYGWRMPRFITEFIEKSRLQAGAEAYFLLTCGDSAGNAGKYAEKLCLSKNLAFKGCRGIRMPENYIAMFSVPDEETCRDLIKEADRVVEKTAEMVQKGEILHDSCSMAGKIESSLVNCLFYKFIVKARGFRSTDQCISCGMCVDICPLNNISLKDGRPVWEDRCTHCMACICRCPQEAIEYKKASEGKRRYYLKG